MASKMSAHGLLARIGLACLVTYGVVAQPVFASREGEFSLTGGRPGDQTSPSLSIGASGGYVVWQDNAVDGSGMGVAAMKVNNYFSPVPSHTFRVNQYGAADQEKPDVQLLPGGGAVFVWQGGAANAQDVVARFLGADGIFSTGDLLVNTYTHGQQGDADVALLEDGSVVVVWSSVGQDGSMAGVFAQRFRADGQKIGGEVQINQFEPYNQRTPVIAGLEGGNLAVGWISEQQRFFNSVDLYARVYDADLTPRTSELLLSGSTNVCANPALSATAGGGFVAAWSERDLGIRTSGWYVMARGMSGSGMAASTPSRVCSTQEPGSRFAPRLARIGDSVLAVWTVAYDGNREGVVGRFMDTNGSSLSDEFRVNTTTISQQFEPAVASDGSERFLAVWSSFVGVEKGFELMAQRYAVGETVPAPSAPSLSALDSYSLLVSWPELAGYESGVAYRLYLDGSSTPVELEANHHVVDNLMPASTHTAQLAYLLSGRVASPKSSAVSATTWGADRNFDGLADDWQSGYWGENSAQWPAALLDSDEDGASNLAEFLAGTDPTDAESVLRIEIEANLSGVNLSWNVQPGSLYQLERSSDLAVWVEADNSRFAATSRMTAVVSLGETANYYRVIRIRE